MEIGRIDLGPKYLPVKGSEALEIERLTKRVSDLEMALAEFTSVTITLAQQVARMAQVILGDCGDLPTTLN